MIKHLKYKFKSSRNVLVLMTGTFIAQALSISIAPILTRIYTPEEFGLFALYMAIVSVLTIIATGRYELAIMLPKKEEDALQILLLASLTTVTISFIVLVLIIIFNTQMAMFLQNPKIAPWLYLVPISILITGLYHSLNYWHNRNKRYLNIAYNRVTQSVGTALSQLGFSVWQQSIGLIAGQLIGHILALGYFLKTHFKNDRQQTFRAIKIRALAKRYSQFPKIDVPTALTSISANQAPNILLATLFSASSAGFYYLTERVLQVPIKLISSSVLDVFKERAAKDYKKYGHCKGIFKKTFWVLFFIALPPSLILYFFAENFFVFVFGEPWREAGVYAKILTPALFLKFIVNPLSFMIYIAEKQVWNFIGMLILIFGIVSSLFISSDPEQAILFISFSYCIFYLLYLYISANLAKVL